MGMYNEVHKSCPDCRHTCTVQIHQIVLGFGGFNLDRPDDLAESLNESQLLELKDALREETFWCLESEGGCGNHFHADANARANRSQLANELFGRKSECPCCRYPNCGHYHG